MKLIIDTDPGIDDAMAILFAFAHPEIDILAMTSIFGNVRTRQATRNALALCDIYGAPVPIHAGAEAPLVMPARPHADFVHGAEGFGDLSAPVPSRAAEPADAAQMLIDTCAKSPGEVTICAIGPLTNLALALRRDPGIADTAARIVVMGGSLRAGGNATPYGEANIVSDPHAAAEVIDAPWQVDLVGLDVTSGITCMPEDFHELARKSPRIGGFLDEAATFYFRFYKDTRGVEGCALHDPTAIIAAIRPDWLTWTTSDVDVRTSGDRLGETTERGGPPTGTTRWASHAQGGNIRDLFLQTLAEARRAAILPFPQMRSGV